jgi:hypothetical protein
VKGLSKIRGEIALVRGAEGPESPPWCGFRMAANVKDE